VISIQADQIINFIGAILGGGIIGAIISALATIFFGERRVETLRRRREHSMKLNDGVLKPWLSKVGEYCKIGATYSCDVHKIVGLKPNDPTELAYFDVAKSHLETRYPSILEAWEEFKRVTYEHNQKLATVLEKIRTLIVKEFKMPCYYWSLGAKEPKAHVKPDRIAQQIYQEIEDRVKYNIKWFRGEPRISPVIISDEKFYRLEWGNNLLIRSRDEKRVESSIPFISELVETQKFQEEEKSLTKRKNEFYQRRREDFEIEIKNVIKSIELGNILKGKCRFCP
jgi:hypothetical protein